MEKKVTITYGVTNYHSYKKAAKKLRSEGYTVKGIKAADYDFNVHVGDQVVHQNHLREMEIDHDKAVEAVKSLYPVEQSAYCTIS